MIRASLLEFEQRGVTDDDLLKVKAKIEADSIFGLQSVQGKVSQLAYNETFFGQPDLIAADIARYNAVTQSRCQSGLSDLPQRQVCGADERGA